MATIGDQKFVFFGQGGLPSPCTPDCARGEKYFLSLIQDDRWDQEHWQTGRLDRPSTVFRACGTCLTGSIESRRRSHLNNVRNRSQYLGHETYYEAYPKT